MEPAVDLSFLKYLLPVCAVVFFLSLGFLGTLFGGVMRWLFRSRAAPLSAEATWVENVFRIWTGDEDSASWDRSRAQGALKDWYGAADRAGLDGVLEDLFQGQTDHVAWDLVRAVDLMRIGQAAGYLSPEEGLAKGIAVAKRLQKAFGSWEEVAANCEAGMLAWQDRSGITDKGARSRIQRNLPGLRSHYWPRVDFQTPL